jgi:hypothetical protein
MAQAVSNTVRDALGSVVKNVGVGKPAKTNAGPLSDAKGVAAGVGLAAAVAA